MADPAEIARIAAGLTKAQRKVVLKTSERWSLMPGGPKRLRELTELGLCTMTIPSSHCAYATPLGLLVRAHLQENPDAK
jgi:hypothetical protein